MDHLSKHELKYCIYSAVCNFTYYGGLMCFACLLTYILDQLVPIVKKNKINPTFDLLFLLDQP